MYISLCTSENGMLEVCHASLTMVDVKITIERNNIEEEALHHVNVMINKLVSEVQNDLARATELCKTFIQSTDLSGKIHFHDNYLYKIKFHK